jgi:predicted N-acyltransferase
VALPLPYQDMDHYLGSLSHNARRSLKRKMRSLRELRIEMRNSADGVEDQLFPLFENTRNQSKYRYGEFEDLNRDLFKRVMGELGEKARLILCWKGDKLVCFLLMLVDRDRIIGKYIGMVYPEAREFNLYSLAVLKLIESAMECRIGRVELGVSTYPAKLLFGGHMERRWLYYRCLNPWLDAAHVLDFLFDFERNDKDVRRLSARVRD